MSTVAAVFVGSLSGVHALAERAVSGMAGYEKLLRAGLGGQGVASHQPP
ncbi:MAG: hypothetical protein WAN20_19710 [Pseudonocardiaceae bacterium]